MATYGSREDFSFERFLYALHSCPSPDEMRAVVGRFIRNYVPARGFGWYQFNPGTIEPWIIKARGVSERFLERYEREGRVRDPLFRRLTGSLRTVCSDLDLSRSERSGFLFQEEISSGQVGHAIEAPLVIGGALAGTLNVSREAQARPFRRVEVERLAMLARHASLAIARTQRINELERCRAMLEAACDALGVPLIVSDNEGRVLFANRAANRLFDARGCALTSGLRITAGMLADERLQLATAFVPLAAPPGAGLIVRSARLDSAGTMVSFLKKGRREQASPLTAREQEMVELVTRGLNNLEIAAAASISRNTVKQHLKHVFEKTGVRSRAELAARFAAQEHRATASTGGAPQARTFAAPALQPRSTRP